MNNKKQNTIVFILLLFINALYIDKYLGRYMHYAAGYALLYVLLAVITYIIWRRKEWKMPGNILWVLSGIVIVSSVSMLYYLPVEKLNVDRWSVIYSFFSEMHSGRYPYGALSNMNNSPGPLPVYFAIAYPFYMVKEIGFMPILSLAIFIAYLIRRARNEEKDYSFTILLLITSPFMYWEILTRDTLFFMSVLWYIYADWLLNKGFENRKQILIAGVLGGLLLSTRFIYVILVCIYGIYFLKKKVRFNYIFTWGLTLFIVFSITIIPFYLAFPADFLKNNPFHTESSSFMPFWFNLLFPPIAICCGIFAKNNSHTIFLSGIALFLVILIYFLFRIWLDGWTNAFYNSYADISYFIIPAPFLLAALSGNSKDEGKITERGLEGC